MEHFSLGKEDTVWTYLKTVANKKYTFEDTLYKEGNEACKMQLQYVAVEEKDDALPDKSEQVSRFQCAASGCGHWLGSVLEQEVHYNASHRHSCGLCRAQLPSFHLLQIHLEESHDSLFRVRAERQPMYRCLLESCEVLSWDADSRRQHCLLQHQFPADFSYCPRPPPAAAPAPPTPFTPPRDATPSSWTQPRLRFSYRVPAQGASFGAGAVASLGVGAAFVDGTEIDMASLAAALEPEPL